MKEKEETKKEDNAKDEETKEKEEETKEREDAVGGRLRQRQATQGLILL